MVYGMIWYGLACYGMVWYGMVWYGMVWYGMVWYGMVWYGMVYGNMCMYIVIKLLLPYYFLVPIENSDTTVRVNVCKSNFCQAYQFRRDYIIFKNHAI